MILIYVKKLFLVFKIVNVKPENIHLQTPKKCNTPTLYSILMSAVDNAEKYTVEEFIAHMEKQGYKWINFKDNNKHKQ